MKKRNIKLKNVFMIVFIIYTAVTLVNQQLAIAKLRKTEKEAEQRINVVALDNDKLRAMINNATSPEYIEKMAREQLGLVKSGEKVYIDQSADESKGKTGDH